MLCLACATICPQRAAQPPGDRLDLIACTAADWRLLPVAGLIPHVRTQHYEVSCQQDHKANYFPRFIGNHNDALLEDACYSIV